VGTSIPPWPGWCFTLRLIPISRSREDFRCNSLSLGLVRFGSQLQEIEDQTKAGAEAGLAPLLDLLPTAAEQAQADLRQWLEARPETSNKTG
jgi:hypothetical protein